MFMWGIVGLATAGVIVRPFNWPEAVWALAGALLLLLFGYIGVNDAWRGVAKGLDVYLFLIGMMLLSELARREGLFDWLASKAVAAARGSASRLFFLIYAVGTLVTIFLSNDATAVVLTPAVYAATKAAKVKNPLPYLYICAFVSNAASFVLPISNPANLVVFGGGSMPPLASWVAIFAVPSIVAIITTYIALRFMQASALAGETLALDGKKLSLRYGGRVAASGILATAAALIAASALGFDLGLPTLLTSLLTTLVVLSINHENPLPVLRGVSWGVLPLVAGLFILVEALDKTGAIRWLADALAWAVQTSLHGAIMGTGLLVALGCNLANNLPAGLVAGSTVHMANVPHAVASSILIGVDLGPNLSVTGSLATILWLNALRRDGQRVGALQFLKLGVVVTLPALFLTIGSVLLLQSR